ncbi:MAG: sugar transferase [Bacteroidota bacterium]|nr:sugar transferase [Bacteroidota bacterium]
MIRFFDILFSLVGIIVLSPVLMIIYFLVIIETKGGGFYIQKRVGRGGKIFKLYKFRSMSVGADKKGLITVGGSDPRMTRMGIFIRRFKLDELPQLFNVLNGTMSLVGPRPEVQKYVELYTPAQYEVLSVKPGITDYASIEYVNENIVLGKADNPEKIYIDEILPAKIQLNMKYIQNRSLKEYFFIIFLTLWSIIKRKEV